MALSISQQEKPINENKRTAIFYTIPEVAEYIVEIRYHNDNYFIGENQEPSRFGNLEGAKLVARQHHAEQGFLALDKTYQEVEMDSTHSPNETDRFDYVPIAL